MPAMQRPAETRGLAEVISMYPGLARFFLVVVVATLGGGAVLSACGSSPCSCPEVPTCASDAGATDAGATDAGAPDAGAPDGGATDASPADAESTPDGPCLDPVQIRVVITANFNEGTKDAACMLLARDKWLDSIDPGESMFIVGGVHADSPVTDPGGTLGALFGSWVPNTIPMYDDGTHGDEVSQDGIWTIAFSLPRGLRIGYKFTWGHSGDGWTGTEEWPGNQRLLEIVDVNGDGFVYRADNFGDDTTNKDQTNLNPAGDGTVTWTTDTNTDGVKDCQEQKLDTDGDCVGDTWHTPTGVGPVTCS
jgi:hypothetical protein